MTGLQQVLHRAVTRQLLASGGSLTRQRLAVQAAAASFSTATRPKNTLNGQARKKKPSDGPPHQSITSTAVTATGEKMASSFLHHEDSNPEDDMDHLCQKHMELPAGEFAMGCSFLHQVALNNIATIRNSIQQYPALVNFRDYDRRTALHIAASEGHVAICQYLVEHGARINRSDRWGGSPLDDAHRHGHSHVIDYLVQHGAVFGSPSQANNLITAASEGDVEEVTALLEFGSDGLIDECDYDRRTALHLAAGEGRDEIVQLLCAKGAKVNALDRWGNRPLDDAQAAHHDKVVQILLQHGATHGLHHQTVNNASNNNNQSSSASGGHMGNEALLDLMNQYGQIRNGELSMDWHDVQNLLQGIGEEATDEVVQKLFEVADVSGSGVIDTREFLANSDVFLGGRPARIILVVGGPGSGKGVLSQRLVKECGVVHLSSGDLLREEVARGTALGQHVQEIMQAGGLVSSAILVTLMKKKMKDHIGKRILLDGFPRSQENAQDLVTLCGKPELALHLSCDDTDLLERILKRKRESSKDVQLKRDDDNFHTALQRIRTYHKYHHVTLDFLREQNVPIVYLDCSQRTTPESVWEQLCAIGRLMRSAVKLPTEKTMSGSSSSNNNARKKRATNSHNNGLNSKNDDAAAASDSSSDASFLLDNLPPSAAASSQ